jgi:hypothetical protein
MNLNYEEETEYFHSFDGNKEDLEESQGMDALQRMEVISRPNEISNFESSRRRITASVCRSAPPSNLN